MKRSIILSFLLIIIFGNFITAQEVNQPLTININDHESIMMIIDSESGDIIKVNQAATEFYGYTLAEFKNMKITDINSLSTEEVLHEMELAKTQNRHFFEFNHQLKNSDIKKVEVYSSPLVIEDKVYLFSIIHDVTDRAIAEKRARRDQIIIYVFICVFFIILIGFNVKENRFKKHLKHSNLRYTSLFNNMSEGVAMHKIICDDDGKPIDYIFLQINHAFETITSLKSENILGKSVKEIMPQTEDYWIEKYGDVAVNGNAISYENYSVELDKHFKVNVYQPFKDHFVTIFRDVTDEKNRIEKITYLSFHDQLTGLYNRHFYQQESYRIDTIEQLPITLLMIDVNGLKLTNDAFGHNKGDELLVSVANCLRKVCRESDIISRVGGDEFVVLLPNTTHEVAKQLVKRIYLEVSKSVLDEIVISVSIGWETKETDLVSMNDVFVKAEEHMYRKKLIDSQSMRNETIKVIINTLSETNHREKIHSEQVSKLAGKIGQILELSAEDIKELEIAGLMHDIGKIATSNTILNKEGALTESEYEEIKKHPEKGYHILKAVNQYSELADYALSHHERWDGKGYPRGLKGEEIPLLVRIITVADAYEAMTADRPYRKGMSKEEAYKELQRCAGTQFDPIIIRKCKHCLG